MFDSHHEIEFKPFSKPSSLVFDHGHDGQESLMRTGACRNWIGEFAVDGCSIFIFCFARRGFPWIYGWCRETSDSAAGGCKWKCLNGR